MAKKTNKMNITQKDGVVEIFRNGELEQIYDFNRWISSITSGTLSNIGLANMVAEIINDCLNCKSTTSALKDLNDKKAYRGTYFDYLDYIQD